MVQESENNADSEKTADTVSGGSERSTAVEDSDEQKKGHGHRRRWIIIVIVVVVVLLALAALFCFYRGVLAPSGAAAKYDACSYVEEQDVTDYIDTYRSQMGVSAEEVDDEGWATFLATYNLTPEILRRSTVSQLIYNDLIYKKCSQLGITVSDEEIDEVVDTAKDSMALGSDEIWRDTLESYGQSEEEYRQVCELRILREKLYSAEVEMPEASDEETLAYVTAIAPQLEDPTTKHTYYFLVEGTDEDETYENLELAQSVRKQFLEGDMTTEAFTYLVVGYSNSDELVERGGANGWDLDTSEYEDTYLEILANLDDSDVSDVFMGEDGYGFIWVDETFTFPTDSDELQELTAADFPESLWSYLADYTAYEMWEADCSEYLDSLYEDAGVIIFNMPADVPYNVDMSLAQTSEDESTAQDSSEDGSDTAEESGEESDTSASG